MSVIIVPSAVETREQAQALIASLENHTTPADLTTVMASLESSHQEIVADECSRMGAAASRKFKRGLVIRQIAANAVIENPNSKLHRSNTRVDTEHLAKLRVIETALEIHRLQDIQFVMDAKRPMYLTDRRHALETLKSWTNVLDLLESSTAK